MLSLEELVDENNNLKKENRRLRKQIIDDALDFELS